MAASTRRGCPPAAPRAGAGSSRARTLAARLFSAGGAGLRWAQLAGAAAALAEYRLQWRVAEQVAAGCDGPGGLWRHALLVDGGAVEVSVHAGLPAAAASVAAQRAVDERSIRWAEPVAAAPRRTLH